MSTQLSNIYKLRFGWYICNEEWESKAARYAGFLGHSTEY